MKKLAVALTFIGLLNPLFSNADQVLKLNFKRTFCNGQDFLGNPGAKRPHLHCGDSFITYKKVTGDHSNLSEHGNCKRTNDVFTDIKSRKTAFEDYQAIYNALVAFHKAGCPNQ